MSLLWSNLRRTGILLFVTVLIIAACQGEEARGGGGGAGRGGLTSNAACPYHDSVRIEAAVFDTLPLVGVLTGIPEYHDCQRMIDETGSNYGPLVGLFAVASLAGFELTPAIPLQGNTFRQGPVSADPAAANVPVPAAAPHPPGFPVGIIVDFDRVGYDRLGIKPGVNCLYLYPDPNGPDGIGAKIVPVTQAQGCARSLNPELVGTELEVRSSRMPFDHPTDYPPVARWDWDPSSSTQYIGIACGRKWCEIGPKSAFTPSQRHLYTILDRKERRVFAVKGWYDEQWLARRGTAGLYPEPFKGTLVPVKNLAEMDATTFENPNWVDVARVSISPHDPVYESKFGFTTSGMPNKMNQIALCQGSWADCLAADPPPPISGTAPVCNEPTDGRWWARIINTKGAKFYQCVTRHAHVGVDKQGTARWHWTKDDELIWIECDEGCCRVHSGDM